MPFICRPAILNDHNAITQLSSQWGYPISREKMVQNLREILRHSDHQVMVLQHEKDTAAWIHGIYSFRIASDPFVEIVGLVVDAQYRRRGMGRFLVEKIVQWAKDRDCSLVRVRCHIIREEANIFYSDLGFQEIKQQKVYDLPL